MQYELSCLVGWYRVHKRPAMAQLVEALRYKPEGRGFQFSMVSPDFFIDIILPVALWPWV